MNMIIIVEKIKLPLFGGFHKSKEKEIFQDKINHYQETIGSLLKNLNINEDCFNFKQYKKDVINESVYFINKMIKEELKIDLTIINSSIKFYKAPDFLYNKTDYIEVSISMSEKTNNYLNSIVLNVKDIENNSDALEYLFYEYDKEMGLTDDNTNAYSRYINDLKNTIGIAKTKTFEEILKAKFKIFDNFIKFNKF